MKQILKLHGQVNKMVLPPPLQGLVTAAHGTCEVILVCDLCMM